MLTPEYLDRVADDVIDIYSQFEISVINDIARRISKMNYLTSTAEFQVQQLNEAGLLTNYIISQLSDLTGISEEEVATTFESSTIKSHKFDNRIYENAGKDIIPLASSPQMLNVLDANILKTNGNLANLSNTTATTSQRLFIQQTSIAHLQVQSGVFTPDQAINMAVKNIAREGVTVQYPTGEVRTVESAVRSNVLTGVNQTALEIQETNADLLDSDLVEVTAHAGARDTGTGIENHQLWQGKIYSRSGRDKQYGGLVEKTGYGSVLGLGGVNCRHSMFPYFRGQTKAFTEEVLNSYKKSDVTYNGKELSYYEATQKQRYIERQIRRWKREAEAQKVSGIDASFSNSKVRQWQARARDFINQTQLNRDYTRERIAR